MFIICDLFSVKFFSSCRISSGFLLGEKPKTKLISKAIFQFNPYETNVPQFCKAFKKASYIISIRLFMVPVAVAPV